MKKGDSMRPVLFWGAVVLTVFILFVDTFAALSLRNGLMRSEAQLGADVIVVPRMAASESGEPLLVQGAPAHAYMEESTTDALRAMTGVAQAAPQLFLASGHAGCCSTEVQIIGFDPAADFTIQPWVRERSADALAFGDVLVGSGVSVHADAGLTLYDTPCRVVGRLLPTGTAMDTAVYTSLETTQAMALNAAALHTEHLHAAPPVHAVSAVLIRTAEGFSPEGVAAAVNETYPDLSARAANGMVQTVARGLGGLTGPIAVLLAGTWLLGILLLAVLFRIRRNRA